MAKSKKGGYITLHKQIQDHWMWQEKPFTRGQAWIDLLMLANYEDGELLCKGTLIHIKRGQVFRSLQSMADRWGWSVKKVRNFLTLLENEQMGHAKGHAQGMLITIENYSKYQIKGQAKGPAKGNQRATSGQQINKEKNKELKKGTALPPQLKEEMLAKLRGGNK